VPLSCGEGDVPPDRALMTGVAVCPTIAYWEEGPRPWVVGSPTWSTVLPSLSCFLSPR